MIRDLFRTNVGVKQGDNLTPNLFKICINELPDCIKSSPDQAVVYSRPVYSLLYIYMLMILPFFQLQQKDFKVNLMD